MRDLVFLLYIVAWIALARYVNRLPFWQPHVVRLGDVSFVPDQRPAGCMMALCLGVGAMVGATLPMAISELMPHAGYQFSGGTHDLNALGRIATLVGGVCGGYVGLRGSRLWVILFLLGMAVYVLSGAMKWIFGGI